MVEMKCNEMKFYISDQFDEDLEGSLISYFRPPIGTLDKLITKICYNLTEYCEGHGKEAERNKKDQVTIEISFKTLICLIMREISWKTVQGMAYPIHAVCHHILPVQNTCIYLKLIVFCKLLFSNHVN